MSSDANDNNNGYNEFKQFRIIKWRRPALVAVIFFSQEQNLLFAQLALSVIL